MSSETWCGRILACGGPSYWTCGHGRARCAKTARPGRRLISPMALASFLAGVLLFWIDITQPRGVVDGVGYPAVVALTSRFGKRTLLIAAVVTSTLTILGSALVPDAGISVTGMWANRGFALISIWAVALVMRRRIDLEEQIRQRETSLHRHKAALAAMVRECLLTDISLDERLDFICRTGAQRAGVQFCRSSASGTKTSRTSTVCSPGASRRSPNLLPPGRSCMKIRFSRRRLQSELTVAVEDIELHEANTERRRLARNLGARASLAAAIYHRRRRAAARSSSPRRTPIPGTRKKSHSPGPPRTSWRCCCRPRPIPIPWRRSK